tara:strand:- start:4706 stop:5251 length:546 start_codon:yes stop_codon:yes gene_type:complete
MLRRPDIYYLEEAFKTARDLSQDPNTQTGAVIVNPEGKIISRGANRLHWRLRKIYGEEPPQELVQRPLKYTALTHAERDAVFSANREGKSLIGCTIYTTWASCSFCAEVVINNGIVKVVTHQSTTDWYDEARKDIEGRQDWSESIKRAISAFEDNNIIYQCLTKPIKGIEIIFDDKRRSPK